MKNDRKVQIKEAFEAPKPIRKREFFRNVETEPVSEINIILQQFQYISKASWFVAIAVLCISFYLKQIYSDIMLSIALSLMPFLALTNVIESMRSKYYGMAELEMSCRFSVKSIMLIRMEIVGIENLFVGIILAFLINESIFLSIVYLFTPYLLTTYVCLLFSRKGVDREQVCFFAGITLLISWFMFLTVNLSRIYNVQYIWIWLCAIVFLAFGVVKEYRQILQAGY